MEGVAKVRIIGDSIELRPLEVSDTPRLLTLLDHPEVKRWWSDYPSDPARLHRDFFDDEETVAFAIEADGQMVGVIQYSEENEPDYRHASIDIAVDGDLLGRGYGTDAVRALARHLIHARGHHRLTIDPAVANVRAIGAYAKVGFKPVGVMRSYERGLDGAWRDGLLMDLLAAELQ